jgi:hypothetical protein
VPEAFYRDLGAGRVWAGPSCVGPWDPQAQHGGPPAALLGRTVERLGSWPGTVARIGLDILGPVPLGELEVGGSVLRPGRRVELVAAELRSAGRTVMTARAWRIRTEPLDLPADAGAVPDAPPGPGPGALSEAELTASVRASADALAGGGWSSGFLSSMAWHFLDGGFHQVGPATVWARPLVELVEGEAVSPLQRLLLLADCGNGVSSVLDLRRWLFINPELTVHLQRYPDGDWLCLQARTMLSPATGTGVAEGRLWDAHGVVGRASQALLVAPRGRTTRMGDPVPAPVGPITTG